MLMACKSKKFPFLQCNSSKSINIENTYRHQDSDFDGMRKFADVTTRLEILKRDIEIEEINKYAAGRAYDVKKKEI